MTDRADPNLPAPSLARSATELYDQLRRFFLRQLRPAERGEADDLVQDVFVQLARRSEGADVRQTDAYAFVTATNLLRDRVRRRAVRHASSHEQFDETLHAEREDVTPERVLVGKQSIEKVQAALLTLPERTRTIFLLHRFERMRHPEIARRYGVSVSLVEKEIARAMQHLAASLGKAP